MGVFYGAKFCIPASVNCLSHHFSITKNDVTACLSFVGNRQPPFLFVLVRPIVDELNRSAAKLSATMTGYYYSRFTLKM